MDKPAKPNHEILDVLSRRWSPRAFDSRPVEQDKLLRLFEAARWSASSFNEQPWRFIVGTKDDPEQYEKVLSCLVEFNASWASGAPVVMLGLTKKTFTRGGKFNRVHQHDLGLAMGNLSAQATAEGLFLHQMAGIEPDRVREVFNVPEDFEPQTGCAIGYGGDPQSLPEKMRDDEVAPRTRKAFDEFIFGEAFGKPSPLVQR
ncbi:nitroreductase family protein [Phycisphaerales bacterium AB-hyl4]|uniref:Nitroreductase family protein n=1 Tax=Natronomicrosphaera hydrolytica TaxID=3242702 RepID=A0ABV4U3B4_9BACT